VSDSELTILFNIEEYIVLKNDDIEEFDRGENPKDVGDSVNSFAGKSASV
jgi:hypothetical protein